MATIAKTAFGTLLKIGDSASPEVFTLIPEVMRITAPNVATELIDVTSHDSPGAFREFIAGLQDAENLTAEFNWVPSNVVHKGLRTDAYAATKRNFQIVFPDATDNTIKAGGFIVGLQPVANVGEQLRNTLTVRITGEPVWT